jgi:hypothetical protein
MILLALSFSARLPTPQEVFGSCDPDLTQSKCNQGHPLINIDIMMLSSKLRHVRCSGRLNSKRLILKAKTTDTINIDDDPEAKYRRYGPWFGKNFVLPISSIFEGVPRVRVRTNDSRRETLYLLELPVQLPLACINMVFRAPDSLSPSPQGTR